jgi:hypothetical protein
LERGGDPNESLGDSTVWREYLRYLETFGDSLQQLDATGRQAWIDVTELLIRYGAARVLEKETIIPRQSVGRTRVRLRYRELLARRSIAAAFGEEEAARLDSISLWLEATGQNLLTKVTRTLRSFSSSVTSQNDRKE